MTPAAPHLQLLQPAPTADLGAEHPSVIEQPADGAGYRTSQELDVGLLTASELDALIAGLGRMVVRSYRLGDRATAVKLLELQRRARAARSPQHVAAQDAEHLQRVEEGVGYFSSEHAAALGRAGGGA